MHNEVHADVIVGNVFRARTIGSIHVDSSVPSEDDVAAALLGDVLVVEPEPVSPAVAADYLARVLPGWGGVDAVRAGATGGVGEVVTTAFGLWLVGVAGGDDLLDLPDADAVRTRLPDRLVPALVACGPTWRASSSTGRLSARVPPWRSPAHRSRQAGDPAPRRPCPVG